MINKATMKEYASRYSIAINDDELDKFSIYADMLLEWNQKVNLTAITDPDDIVIKHFLDSIMLLPYITKANAKIIDVGTGAGFPGVPLKILRPDINLTLLDSSGKRVKFLNCLSERLKQDNLCIHGRAEEASRQKKFRDVYDYAVVRAVAPLNILCELCLPLLTEEGYFLACKGKNADNEVIESLNAIDILGGKLIENVSLSLPNENTRSIIIIKKISQTPSKYPRMFAKISKSPL